MYTLKNLSVSGNLKKSIAGNAQFSINTSEDILIEGCEFGQTGYNCLEIGLKEGCKPKNVTIQNCNFTGTLSNNAILLFDNAEDAVLTIKNCTFTKLSNPIRLSCRSKNALKVYIENCECTEWESDNDYAGMILLQDYTSTAETLESDKDRFKNVEIYIKNFKVPETFDLKNDKGYLLFEEPDDICATGSNKTQIVYMYCSKASPNLYSYDSELFPKIELY